MTVRCSTLKPLAELLRAVERLRTQGKLDTLAGVRERLSRLYPLWEMGGENGRVAEALKELQHRAKTEQFVLEAERAIQYDSQCFTSYATDYRARHAERHHAPKPLSQNSKPMKDGAQLQKPRPTSVTLSLRLIVRIRLIRPCQRHPAMTVGGRSEILVRTSNSSSTGYSKPCTASTKLYRRHHNQKQRQCRLSRWTYVPRKTCLASTSASLRWRRMHLHNRVVCA